MSGAAYGAGLHPIRGNTYAYLQPPGSWGLSNCGLVTNGGEAVLVDTLFTLELTRRLLDTVHAALPATRITTVVNTHANGDHCWGNQLLPDAQIVGSQAAAKGMADEISPAAMMRMMTDTAAGSPLGDYMRRFFADFDFSGIVLTPPTRTFAGETVVDLGGRVVHLMQVGPAHTSGDVIVHVPDDGVVFAGDILFIGDHPIMWSGPVTNWIIACQRILDTGADIIVPGHGPPTNRAGVIRLRDYLQHVYEHAAEMFARGVPYEVAAARMPLDDYAEWGHRERLVVTVGVIYRNLGWADPDDNTTMITRMAEAFHRTATRGGVGSAA